MAWGVEAVKKPFGPRLGALVPLAVQSWMAGSLTLVMYWAVPTTLCCALRSEAEQLLYQAVMLSMVQMLNFFEDLRNHDKSFQSPEGE